LGAAVGEIAHYWRLASCERRFWNIKLFRVPESTWSRGRYLARRRWFGPGNISIDHQPGSNGEPDHVHLLVNFPPKVRLSELVNSLKGVSSRLMKQEFPAISTFWSVGQSGGALWSPSYFVGSVGGAPITILRQYIEAQNRPRAL
jgi:hypothetical protein